MRATRRQFLTSLGAGAAGIGLAACSRPGQNQPDGDDAAAALALAWWGNDVRNANTEEAATAYTADNPDVTISTQPAEWAGYWDRLATQTAAGDSPDVIQMDITYLSEYGQRGALLDLSDVGIDTSAFATGTEGSGVIGDAVYGVNGGINVLTIMVNADLLGELGVDVPDDQTWTWDDLRTLAADVAEASDGEVPGASGMYTSDALLHAWLRQQDKSLFTEAGELGFTADDIAAWFTAMITDYVDVGALPDPTAITEDLAASLDQRLFTTGRTGLANFWSNQLETVTAASGTDVQMLRYPSLAGDFAQSEVWYNTSMLCSVSAGSASPDAAAALVDWWVNSRECADICLAERGIPANSDILSEITPALSESQQVVAELVAAIEPQVTAPPVVPPPGGGQLLDLLSRYGGEVHFGSSDAATAGQGLVDELRAGLS